MKSVDNQTNELSYSGSPQLDSAADHQQQLSRNLNTHQKQLQKPLSEQKEESIILQKYGVERTKQDGLIQYRMPGASDHKVLFEAPSGATEFSQSQHKLDALTQAKIDDLKVKYHVSFSAEGENAVQPWVVSKKNPDKFVHGDMLHARVPRLSELMGVDAALQASQPSQFLDSHGQAALKFYFLKTPTFGKDTYDAGLYAADEHKKNSVFFEPDSEPDRPITVADAIQKHQPIKSSVEALAAHEIAHNAEWNMGLWDPDKLKPLAEKMGWTTSADSQYWLLKGQAGDYYRLTNDGLSNDKGWIACDDKGTPLDAAGRVVNDAASAPHLTTAEVREKALVRPPTDYFTAPDEMLADSLMLYRVGEEGRKELIKSGTQLYGVVKDFDQSEMDSRFGKNADGSSKKIRLPDGDMVENSAQSKQLSDDFDASLTN
jgi:hypothetical protein